MVRPNIECTNGYANIEVCCNVIILSLYCRYIHIVDTVMLDDSPPWTVGGAGGRGRGAAAAALCLLLLVIR